MTTYDIVVAGAGLSAAALVSMLKYKYKILVLEMRNHVGGNCYDYPSGNGHVHLYGPHIFHTPDKHVLTYLSRFTSWKDLNYSVSAEILISGHKQIVPFPYSMETINHIGKPLTAEEVVDYFFRGYSKKMWDMEYHELPDSIKGRVPKDCQDKCTYFPGQTIAYPKDGYTKMITKMFDGVDIILNARELQWKEIDAKYIVYCGRIDRLPINGTALGRKYNWLGHRSLDIKFRPETEDSWPNVKTSVVNFCHGGRPYTRKVHYGLLHKSSSNIISVETPCAAGPDDVNPFYPIPTKNNIDRYNDMLFDAKLAYSNMYFLGRTATYKYIDMYQAVMQGLQLANEISKG